MGNCDKCRRPVPMNNDAVNLDSIVSGEPMIMLFAGSRHLLPIIEDGQVVCEGSPSRAQYIEGQARDKRPEYPYRPEYEGRIRVAYAQMQQEAMAENADLN